MDAEKLRAEKLEEITQKSRQMAVDEILVLKKNYQATKDLNFSFEQNGKMIDAIFVTAALQSNPPNAYRIELIAPVQVIAEGQCHIKDRYGRRIGAIARTTRGHVENRIILEALAIPTSANDK